MTWKNSEIYSVAVYLCDRTYGGSEEGGWWYDCGELAEDYGQFTRYFFDEDMAYTYANRLQVRLCSKLNEGRREISSVLSNGRYYAEVHDGKPMDYPIQRPHYE